MKTFESPREVFDFAKATFLAMKKPAVARVGFTCMYRVGKKRHAKLRCVIGAMIPDELYTSKIEYHTVDYANVRGCLIPVFPFTNVMTADQRSVFFNMVSLIQSVHDLCVNGDVRGIKFGSPEFFEYANRQFDAIEQDFKKVLTP